MRHNQVGFIPKMQRWLNTHKSINMMYVCLVADCVWLFATPWTVAHQAPLSLGVLQARTLELVTMPFSRGSSQPRVVTQASHIAGEFFTVWATHTGKSKNTEVGSLSLFQGIFLTQELNRGLLRCRWSLYQLSCQGGPISMIYHIERMKDRNYMILLTDSDRERQILYALSYMWNLKKAEFHRNKE